MEDNKQLILEGQHHIALNTVGKEAFSFPQKQVIYYETFLCNCFFLKLHVMCFLVNGSKLNHFVCFL